MKKLRDFDLLIGRAGKNLFVQCSSMFIFPRKVISNIYPDFPDDNILKVYMYLSKHCASTDAGGQVPGDIFVGKQRIETELNMTSYTVNNAVKWLEQNHFILDTGKTISRTVLRRVLVAPDYLPGRVPHEFYSCARLNRDLGELKKNNYGYIMLPPDLFSETLLSVSTSKSNRFMGKKPIWEQPHWDGRKLKILIMLYAHYWLRYFGGVDPNIVSIHRDSKTKESYLNVHPSFCADVKEDQNTVERTVASFVENGLFIPVLVIIRQKGFGESLFAGDVTSTYLPEANDKQIYVLRPRFMFQRQIDDYNLGGRLLI